MRSNWFPKTPFDPRLFLFNPREKFAAKTCSCGMIDKWRCGMKKNIHYACYREVLPRLYEEWLKTLYWNLSIFDPHVYFAIGGIQHTEIAVRDILCLSTRWFLTKWRITERAERRKWKFKNVVVKLIFEVFAYTCEMITIE